MSYKQKMFSAIAAGFAVVSFSAFASAQQQDTMTNQTPDAAQKQERPEHGRGGGDRFGKGEGHGGKMGMREFAQLNLTDAQKQQIGEIMKANRKTENPQDFEEMRRLSQAKRDGVITAEQTEKLKAFKQQMRQNMEQTRQQIMAILTAEQRTQFEKLQQERREKMKQRRDDMRQNKTNGDTQKDN